MWAFHLSAGLGLRATENKMQWTERRDADYLVGDDGKILGRVACSMSTAIYHAVVVYAGGGNHKMELGDYICNPTARAAVEAHVRDVGLLGTEE